MSYEYEIDINYANKPAKADILVAEDNGALYIGTDITTQHGKRTIVQESINMMLPYSEAEKLRDSLITDYPMWIAVKDEHPNLFDAVLILAKDGRMRCGILMPNQDDDGNKIVNNDHIYIWSINSKIQYKFGDVSHWMPLPEPPKGANND
ncbi:DUF551 domain-containing protein [Psychrobacter pygoscelis]|uniref:DUF551 domain-containing protein n=1 Tax=Psychrobacter pygoscelis TaxID=2488563 RepID=UPI001038C3C6|nr:DUF551 domain-containing protein [Psychrobacter pygoscelis]